MSRKSFDIHDSLTRRGFLSSTAAAAAASLAAGCASKNGDVALDRGKSPELTSTGPVVKLPEKIRVGLVGCGGRGTGAALDSINADPAVEIVALGDLFPDRVDGCRKTLTEKAPDRCKFTDATSFSGFDSFQRVLSAPIDLVILATPPGFRPQHFKAAVEAKKHVFMEKPVAVDPTGVRAVIAAAEVASQNGLGVVSGTQRRHQPHYIEAMRRVHAGEIGEIVSAQCYWNQDGLWVKKHEPQWSDMEWQCRNWLYFTWLSGDHICEQHIHNLDVVNWAIGATPEKAVGMGGRQWRTGPEYGNIWDHFSVEFEYPGGVRVISMCRQIDKTSPRVAERIVGTKGVLRTDSSNAEITGKNPWKFEDGGKPVNPYVQEHVDLIASIRAGKPLNEGKRVAESTLTAIMGRMSAYTGRELQWAWALNSSKLDLVPSKLEFGSLPVGEVAMPGVTPLA